MCSTLILALYCFSRNNNTTGSIYIDVHEYVMTTIHRIPNHITDKSWLIAWADLFLALQRPSRKKWLGRPWCSVPRCTRRRSTAAHPPPSGAAPRAVCDVARALCPRKAFLDTQDHLTSLTSFHSCMSMHIWIYIYIYKCTYTCGCTCAFVYACKCRVYLQLCVYACVCGCMQRNKNKNDGLRQCAS